MSNKFTESRIRYKGNVNTVGIIVSNTYTNTKGQM